MRGKYFNDYCSELKLASDQVEAFNLRARGNWRSNNASTGTKQTNSHHQDCMDWQPTRVIHVQKNETKALTNQDTSNKRRATWVSRDAMTYPWRRSSACAVGCGNAGHVVKNCAFLPPHRPMTSNVSTTK